MGSFTQDLKAQLEEAAGQAPPWGDVNPLVVIGLTEAVLDLGLTEDQIHAVIRSYGKQLAAQVHPDRKPVNVSAERQRQIIGAFDLLDSRENFTRALAHFKTLRAEDRREVKILNQTVNTLRCQIDGYVSQYKQFAASREALSWERQEYEELKREEPLVVPRLRAEIKQIRKNLSSERDKYRTWSGNKEAKIKTLRARNALLRSKLRSVSNLTEPE